MGGTRVNIAVECLRHPETAVNRLGKEFLEALRDATSAKHKALDEIVPLMNTTLTERQLACYLNDIAQFHQGFEKHINRILPDTLEQWHFQARWPLIRSDLAVLGINTPSGTSEVVLDWASVDFLSDAVLAGWLYVIEGSALGGAVIHKHLCQVLGAEKTDQLHFFRPYGSNPVSHWRAFQALLLTVANAHPSAGTQIIAAANQAFDWYTQVIVKSAPSACGDC